MRVHAHAAVIFFLSMNLSLACAPKQRDFTSAAASGSGAGGGGTGGGAGIPTPCTVATDCPGAETPCARRACEAGTCAVTFEPKGKAIEAQAVGDCHTIVCDGNGGLDLQVDDADIPDDSNPCTQDLCVSGTPKNPPGPAGVGCGAGLKCDSIGRCTGCQSPGQCPGEDTECQQRSCTNSTCEFIFSAAGTAVMSQTAGDCKKSVCNGMGKVSVIADATDVPSSGKDCLIDGCAMGAPTQTAKAAGATCAQDGGSVCDAGGHCVECVVASTCAGTDTECRTRTCEAGKCGAKNTASGTALTAQTPGDCKKAVCDGQGGVTSADDPSDVPAADNPCATPSCQGGMVAYANAAQGTSCGPNKQCNGQGSCVGCVTAADCPGQDTACGARVCSGGVCSMSYVAAGTATGPQTAGDCKRVACDGAGNVVTIADDGDVPNDSNPCTTDTCVGGTPSFPPAMAGTSCGTGLVCNGSGGCSACVPGTSRICCGVKTTACCYEQPAPGPGEKDVASPGAPIACCCGTQQDCDANGNWGPCY